MKTAKELMDEIAQYPTLDLLLDRDPSPTGRPITDAELLRELERQRLDRALFNIKEDERRDKKRGTTPIEEITDDQGDGTGN